MSVPTTNDETHRADPRLRRMAMWWLLFTVVGGALALWLLQLWLLRGGDLDRRLDALLLAFVGLSIIVCVGLGSLAASLWREGGKVLAENRYPAGSMRTLRDVPVQHGLAARRTARWIRAAAGVLMVAAAVLLIYAISVARQFGG